MGERELGGRRRIWLPAPGDKGASPVALYLCTWLNNVHVRVAARWLGFKNVGVYTCLCISAFNNSTKNDGEAASSSSAYR